MRILRITVPNSIKLAVVFVVVATSAFYLRSSASVAQSQDEVLDLFEAAAQKEKAIVDQFSTINSNIQRTTAELTAAQSLIVRSDLTIEQADAQRAVIGEQIETLKTNLTNSAVEGFVVADEFTSNSEGISPTDEVRKQWLHDNLNKTEAELIEELNGLREEEALVIDTANQAEIDRAKAIQRQQENLERLEVQKKELQQAYGQIRDELDDLEREAQAFSEVNQELESLILERSTTRATISGPFRWPLSNTRITSGYGYRIHPVYGSRRLHAGIDLSGGAGTPITASAAGTVIEVETKGGYGRTVVIDHGGGKSTLYAHMLNYNTATGSSLSVGTEVNPGEKIGEVGASGTATGTHLHFEIRENGKATDPKPFLDAGKI